MSFLGIHFIAWTFKPHTPPPPTPAPLLKKKKKKKKERQKEKKKTKTNNNSNNHHQPTKQTDFTSPRRCPSTAVLQTLPCLCDVILPLSAWSSSGSAPLQGCRSVLFLSRYTCAVHFHFCFRKKQTNKRTNVNINHPGKRAAVTSLTNTSSVAEADTRKPWVPGDSRVAGAGLPCGCNPRLDSRPSSYHLHPPHLPVFPPSSCLLLVT